MSTTTTARRTSNRKSTATPKPAAPKQVEAKVAKVEAPKADAKDFAALAAKDATELHKQFLVWAKEQTGLDLDLKSVQLAFSFRHDFQRSEANQADLANRRAEAEAAKAAKQAKKAAAAKKALAALSPEDLKALLAAK
jgi:hypothetical protein